MYCVGVKLRLHNYTMRVVAVKRSLNEYMVTKEIGSRALRSRTIGLTTSLGFVLVLILVCIRSGRDMWCETPDRHYSLGMMIDMCVYT